MMPVTNTTSEDPIPQILNLMLESVVVLSDAEVVVWTNPSWARLLGYDTAEMTGLPLCDLLADQEILSLTGFASAIEDGFMAEHNVLFKHKNGDVVSTSASGGLLETGELFLIVRDNRRNQDHMTEESRAAAAERQRSEELARAHDALKLANEARERAEVLLRHSQKLDAVGRLAAGMAHEINTPVQFVSDSNYFIKGALKNLLGLISSYREAVSAIVGGAAAEEVQNGLLSLEEDLELGFLSEELPKACDLAASGLGRIATIVRAMKEFADVDIRDKCAADLNHVIENALVVAQPQYQDIAITETELGDLPNVDCHVGDFGQVLINILINATHAIQEVSRETGDMGTIRVTTSCSEGFAEVRISDSGTGIADEVKDKIFDPFFTTKEVGQGSGQGLAIAYAIIVEQHHGEIQVETELGKGSTFVIRLPLECESSAAEVVLTTAS